MKVTLICNSDLLGGASVVTYRLMQALNHEGIDARMLVYTRLTDDPQVEVVGTRTMRGATFLWERGLIYLNNGMNRKDLFKVSVANTGYPLHKHPCVKDADIIVISWINQGLLSLEGIKRIAELGKPIVWTMHDMWNLTGICHHAYDCHRYKEQCGKCPLLGARKENDLSRHTWERKLNLYNTTPIHFVAVSHWLADRCAESSLMKGRDVSVIPNAVPADSFFTSTTHRLTEFGIDYSRNLIVMGAARLDEHIKGLPYAIEALNYLFDNHPEVARHAQIVFFGDLRHPEVLDTIRFPHVWTGRINDPKLLRMIYASSKVVLSSSLYETLPGTIIEGQASGCLPVTFGRGGQSDIVTHLKDGYIAEYLNPKSLAEGLRWALSQNPDRQALHDSVRDRFSSAEVARRYITLFNRLLSK
ncbi:MAG: glycosyltransferase [Bacteroides sp.]|nr:glycosyltransferase [Bacteroides sp.]